MRPDLPRAAAARRAGRLDEAEAALRAVLAREPRHPDALNELGLVALDRNDTAAALAAFQEALAARPGNLDALINLSVVLNRTGRYALAERACLAVLAQAPAHPLAWNNLGLAYRARRRLAEAKRAFTEAWDLAIARFNLGYVHMLEDDLARGLPLLEERKAVLGVGRGLAAPEWNGAPLDGARLLVTHEQGLGDTILMCRFYPALRALGARVVAHVQKPLAPLIAASFPDVEVVTDLAGVRYDAWVAHMSLPHRLGIGDPAAIPRAPWLRVDAPRTPRTRPRVGLNWAGNPGFAYDAVRSTTLENLALLLQVREVEWVSLHRGHREHEAEAFGLRQPLRAAPDFLETARVIGDLDLVVSTETAVPNLSAAMGVRTCVLASPDVDWRWRAWYANTHVCTQDEPGNWFGAIARALEVIRTEVLAAA